MKNSVLVAMALVLASAHVRAAVELPPRPADGLLDQAHVFQPEAAQRLVESLNAARAHDVHIYVATFPTLKVMPSRIREKLEEFRAAIEQQWFEGRVGGVIVFDDESGWTTLGVSADAQRLFSTVAINLVFNDSRFDPTEKRTTPATLEAAATTLARRFTDLKIKADDEVRQQRTRHIAFAAIVVCGVLFGGAGLVSRKRSARVAPESAAMATHSW